MTKTTIKRPFGYARFSNEDLQDEKSITDQQHLYGKLADRETPGHPPIRHFFDEGISGADPMITRRDLQSLLRAVAAGQCDGHLWIESLDRLSRDTADLHTIYKQLTFHGVQIITAEEGVIDEIKIGFKGTMAAMYLKSLAVKTRRGLIGQFKRGRWPSRVPYGYRFDRSKLELDRKSGEMLPQKGVLEVDPITSKTVRQIFEWYHAGMSGEAIGKRLNAEGTPNPSCSPDWPWLGVRPADRPEEERSKWQWGPSTINGNWRRGTGILNNTVYIGKAVFNRQSFTKDPTHVPDLGKKPRRVARLNQPSDWEYVDVPHLQVIADDLWQRVKARQEVERARLVTTGRPERNRRPQFLFSGLTKCGQCGAGFNLYSRSELRCYAKTKMGPTACTNPRTITRQELEGRVLRALKERFLADPIAFEEFCAGFREAQNRARMEQRERIATTKREFDRVTRDIHKVIDAILAGIPGAELKARMEDLQARKTGLLAEMARLEEPEPLLHPRMSDLYREKVENLAAALDAGDDIERERAKDALRGFIEKIVIPADAGRPLMVFGDLGRMLKAASDGGDAEALAAVANGGCGGSQPTLSAALATCGLSQRATLSKGAPSTTRTSFRIFRISSLQGVVVEPVNQNVLRCCDHLQGSASIRPGPSHHPPTPPPPRLRKRTLITSETASVGPRRGSSSPWSRSVRNLDFSIIRAHMRDVVALAHSAMGALGRGGFLDPPQ